MAWTEFHFDVKSSTEHESKRRSCKIAEVFLIIYVPEGMYDDRFTMLEGITTVSSSLKAPGKYRMNVALQQNIPTNTNEIQDGSIRYIRTLKLTRGSSFVYMYSVDGQLVTNDDLHNSNTKTQLGSQRTVHYIDVPETQHKESLIQEKIKALFDAPLLLPRTSSPPVDHYPHEKRNEAISRLLQLYQQRRLMTSPPMSNIEKHFWKQVLSRLRELNKKISAYEMKQVLKRDED